MATNISTMELPFAFLRARARRRRSYSRTASGAVFSFTSQQAVKTITSLADYIKTLRIKIVFIFFRAIIT
jgi:hypothetical protein